MATVDLTEKTFTATIKGNPIVLIDFWAAWCGPCRNFAPIYEAVSQQHPDIVFAKVDTEAEQALARAFNVSAIPTLIVIRDGVVLHAQSGALPEPALIQLVQATRAVDMEEIRTSLANESEDPST